MPLLEIHDLRVSFERYRNGLQQHKMETLHGIELTLEKGEIVAVIGSSGSGKSLLAHALLGILPSNAVVSGSVLYKDMPLTADRLTELRGNEITLIPQSVNYLDPLMRVGDQVRITASSRNPLTQVKQAFQQIGLAEKVYQHYPHQLSGGMARRVLLSTATVSDVQLIIADEPTPGLHAEIVSETLMQFEELAANGTSILMITHDIESALRIADRIAVLYAGTIVEIAPAADFTDKGERLRHPYTRALWRALPQNDFVPIPGSQPLSDHLPGGCLFAPRCALATPDCDKDRPAAREVRAGLVRCIYAS